MPIKSFRGLIADGAQQTISLHTNNGAIGYRIKKLEVFPQKPGQESVESTVLVWTKEQTSVSTSILHIQIPTQLYLLIGILKLNKLN